jgi:hypothetical protein
VDDVVGRIIKRGRARKRKKPRLKIRKSLIRRIDEYLASPSPKNPTPRESIIRYSCFGGKVLRIQGDGIWLETHTKRGAIKRKKVKNIKSTCKRLGIVVPMSLRKVS